MLRFLSLWLLLAAAACGNVTLAGQDASATGHDASVDNAGPDASAPVHDAAMDENVTSDAGTSADIGPSDAGADSGQPAGGADGGWEDGGMPSPSCAESYGALSAGDWLHFGFDDSFTSANPYEQTISPSNVGSLARKWGVGCDDGAFAVLSRAPAVMGGRLFVTKAGDNLKAYDAQCGKLLWQFGRQNDGWAHQPTASKDGTVFWLVGSNPTSLYAIEGQTGLQKWQCEVAFEMGFDDGRLPVVDEKRGLVYLIDDPYQSGTLFALDAGTGMISWFTNLTNTGRTYIGLYPLLIDGKLFVGSSSRGYWFPDQMVRLDGDTHLVDLVYDAPSLDSGSSSDSWQVSSYLACSGMLIARFISHVPATHIVAYALDDRKIVWQKELSEPLSSSISQSLTGACDPASGLVFIPNGTNLWAFDVKTGDVKWTYSSSASVFAPTLANGVLYFISGTNAYAADMLTGAKLAHFPLGYTGYDNSQVAVSHGMLYFSGNGGDCDLFALGWP